MRHLVVHVLTEPDTLGVHSNLEQEQVDAANEVSQGLILDHADLDRLADGDVGGLCASAHLDIAREAVDLEVGDLVEANVLLIEGVDVVLDFSLEELADAQEPSTGRNLVTERFANAGRRKRHFTVVALEQLVEVHKLSLGGLWAEEALESAARADRGVEHEVELHWGGQLGTAAGADDLVVDDDFAKLLSVEVIDLSQETLVLCDHLVVELDNLMALDLLLALLFVAGLLSGDGLATGLLVTLESRLEHFLDQMVGTEDLAGFGVFNHIVAELIDMAGGLEHLVGGESGAVDFLHVLLDDEVSFPSVDDICLQGTASRPVVVETAHTSVNLEGGSVEKAMAQHAVESVAAEFLCFWSGRHSVNLTP